MGGQLPLFNISVIGIVLGATEGILTVVLAALSPAKRMRNMAIIETINEL
jgi:hypothetical protein